MNPSRLPHPAILLVGPTGSGKTPLGEMIETRGLGQRSWRHFDFGAQLRDVVARNLPDRYVSAEDISFLRDLLARGALLEDEQFSLAERILRHFLLRQAISPSVGLVLNGLPRHVGQAEKLDEILEIGFVVELVCSVETIRKRIRTDIGGDRENRIDDDERFIARKLEIYRERTVPLLDYYRTRVRHFVSLPIASESRPDEVWQTLKAIFEKE